MILASDVFTAIRAHLDDDNSGRYNEVSDLCPVVNAAVKYLVSVFNAAFEQKKFAPENLRELVRVEVVPVTGSGNVKKANITDAGLNVWTIWGVEPSPLYADSTTTEEPDIEYETSNKFADRLTLEQWNDSSEDPFSSGSLQSMPTTFKRAAYMGPGRYFGSADSYILIRPSSVFTNDFVGIWYLTNPTNITSNASHIEFPDSLFNVIVDKSLSYISRQHSPESKLGTITERDVIQIISLMV